MCVSVLCVLCFTNCCRQQLPSALAVLSVLDPPAADDVCENGHLQASLGQQVSEQHRPCTLHHRYPSTRVYWCALTAGQPGALQSAILWSTLEDWVSSIIARRTHYAAAHATVNTPAVNAAWCGPGRGMQRNRSRSRVLYPDWTCASTCHACWCLCRCSQRVFKRVSSQHRVTQPLQ